MNILQCLCTYINNMLYYYELVRTLREFVTINDDGGEHSFHVLTLYFLLFFLIYFVLRALYGDVASYTHIKISLHADISIKYK